MKRESLFVLFLLWLSATAIAQPRWEWANSAPISTIAEGINANRMDCDSMANCYTFLEIQGDIELRGIPVSVSKGNLHICKTNQDGDILWVKPVVRWPDSDDFGLDIAVYDTAFYGTESLYVAGSASGSCIHNGLTQFVRPDGINEFVARFNTDCWFRWVLWMQGELDSKDDIVLNPQVDVDPEGNLLYMGTRYSKEFKDSDTLELYFCKKYWNGVNSRVWKKSAYTTKKCSFSDIRAGKNGNFCIAGNMYGAEFIFENMTVHKPTASDSTSDIFLVRFDIDGNAILEKTLGCEKNDSLCGFAVDDDDNVTLFASFYSDSLYFEGDSLVILPNSTNSNYFAIGLNAHADVEWIYNLSNDSLGRPFKIEADSSGNVYFLRNYVPDNSTFDEQLVITKLDKHGNLIWHKSTQNSHSKAYSMSVLESGEVYIVGEVAGDTVYFDTIPVQGYGLQKSYMWAKLGSSYIRVTETPTECISFNTGTASAYPEFGVPPYSYEWNTYPPQYTQTITDLTPGTYRVKVTDGTGQVDFAYAIVNPYSTYEEAEIYICEGESYEFGTNSLSEEGVYFDTLKTIFNCDSIVQLTLHVLEPHTTQVSYPLCKGETVSLYDTVFAVPGVYKIPLQSQWGCDSIIFLSVTEKPSYLISNSVSICEGESYSVGDRDYITSGTYLDTLQTGLGCDSIIETQLQVNDTYEIQDSAVICEGEVYQFHDEELSTSGTYLASFKTVCNCDSAYSLTLSVNNIDTVLQHFSILQGKIITFFDTEISETGVYYEYLTSSLGCDSIIMAEVEVEEVYGLWLPNIFEPSGSDIADQTFYAQGMNIKSFQLKVFDRWGELVFETTDIENKWDGTYKGSELPTGVYAYYAKASFTNGEEVEKKGNITLLR